MPNEQNNYTISEKDLKQWHKFFARSAFPLRFSDRDQMSLGVSESTWNGRPLNPREYYLTPEAYSLFNLEAVQTDDYTKGYRIRTGDQYVFRIGTYHGPMHTNCLRLSTKIEEASVYRPLFSSERTFYLQHTETGQLLSRPWDNYTSGVYGRKAVLLAALNQGGWVGLQQLFEMPMWPLRAFQMAKISPTLKFFLSHEQGRVYANGNSLCFGEVSDGSAVVSVLSLRPSSLHSPYVLRVGGKFVQMNGVDTPVRLVDGQGQATPLCPIKNQDGGYSFWHSESDHVLSLKENMPVFALWKETRTVPLSWLIGPADVQMPLRTDPNGQIGIDDAPYVKKIIKKLGERDYGSRGTIWDYSFNNALNPGWLIATPEDGFGNYGDLPKRIQSEGNDFGLAACSVASSDPGNPCVQLESSVDSPGGVPRWLRAGHSKSIYEKMYKLIISGREIIDITSLLRKDSTPSGEFLAAIRNAITYLSKLEAAKEVTIRLLFGEPLGWVGDKWTKQGPYKTAHQLRDELTRDVGPATRSKMKLFIAYTYTTSPMSWNHAKIIAVDGQRALVGGHNMWDGAYLGANPVLDLSMEVSGRAAVDAHRFAEDLWAQRVQALEAIDPEDAACFEAPEVKRNGTSAVPEISFFQQWFDSRSQAERQKDEQERVSGTGIAVLSVGRSEGTAENDAPSDKAILALLDSAQQSIFISGQALSHKLALVTPRYWPEEFLKALVRALERDVEVHIFLSDPRSGSYIGDDALEVMAQARNYFKNRTPAHIDQKLERLKVSNFPTTARWGLADSEPGLSNHAKVILVDKKVFSIGSQNYYTSWPARMAEFTYMVEDQTSGAYLFSAYFEKMAHWVLPSPPAPPAPGNPRYYIEVVGIHCQQASSGGSAGTSILDQVYVKMGDRKIWPKDRYEEIRNGQKIDFDWITLSAPLRRENAAMVIGIWEWDLFSDDYLWEFTFHIDATIPLVGQNPVRLIDLEPGRIYEREGVRKDDWSRYRLLFKLQVEQ